MKIQLGSKHVRNYHSGCGIHTTFSNLISKLEVLGKEFDSLKNELVDEVKSEILLNELAIDEDKIC